MYFELRKKCCDLKLNKYVRRLQYCIVIRSRKVTKGYSFAYGVILNMYKKHITASVSWSILSSNLFQTFLLTVGRAGWRSRANAILETTVKKVVLEKRMSRPISIAISGNQVRTTSATIDINNELNYVFLPGIEQCILMRLKYI